MYVQICCFIQSSLINTLNKLGAAKFSSLEPESHELETELAESTSKFLLNIDNLIKFKKEVLNMIQIQQKNYESLERMGGILGYMNFKETGKLLPILKGWLMPIDGKPCPVLNVYHNFDENEDHSLYGIKNNQPYNIGLDLSDSLGRPGKLVRV